MEAEASLEEKCSFEGEDKTNPNEPEHGAAT